MILSRLKNSLALLCFLLFFINSSVHIEAAKKSGGQTPAPTPPPIEVEPTIEEVTAKQLERLLEKDYVAVYWCKCVVSAASVKHSLEIFMLMGLPLRIISSKSSSCLCHSHRFVEENFTYFHSSFHI